MPCCIWNVRLESRRRRPVLLPRWRGARPHRESTVGRPAHLLVELESLPPELDLALSDARDVEQIIHQGALIGSAG